MTDQPSNRFGHAAEQLDEAISLFLEGQSVSGLKLAGAADEIFCKALSDIGKQNFLDWKYEEQNEPILTMRHQTKEDFIRDENCALNAIKDMASATEPSVTLDLEEAAYSMIVRACHNHDLLGLPRTAKMYKFDNWFSENVIGPADPLPEGSDCA
jgi:hypothetical protein